MIELKNIQPRKPRLYFIGHEFHADVDKQQIRIHGSFNIGTQHARDFDKTFMIGDTAEADSGNLSIVGNITDISDKTVRIFVSSRNKAYRLCLYEFCYRNSRFNAPRTAATNRETLDNL